jgi:hypothetical protein
LKGVHVLTDHIAIVSLTRDISIKNLLQAAAALQKQITRDFAPFWGFEATVDVFEALDDVPSDYRPIVLFGDPRELLGQLQYAIGEQYEAALIDDFERDRLTGLHLNAFTRQPFSLVEVTDTWSVTLGHEGLEMIADPFGNRLIAAAHPESPDIRLLYLLEVCDPCQAVWYPVNGVPMPDFYTPRYFEPVNVDRTRYSFTGAIERPLQILEGGYLSYIDPRDSGLYQLDAGQGEPVPIASIAQLARTSAPLRTVVDTNPRTPQLTRERIRPARSASAAVGAVDAVGAASAGTALRTAHAAVSLATGAG